ncbi:hypothetical protein D8674_021476 [Pyrus ussuriensis x Pyrus communis]|uniref:Uncharacterized protein n=1 Tax=Pyrus ussuriensis x Pyrus communis TaxID=2448454 RepID=A0A5N5GHR0_9ROSA|nr:hypothetical protein D8674_021476 [Pyrus ussuriensis x Pyrus communis]
MAKQIFYLDNPKAGNGWKVVQKINRRGLYDIPELDHDDNDNNKRSVAGKIARESKTLLHHSGSKPFSYRLEERRQGSKLPNIDLFKDVYVRPSDENTEQLHILTKVLDQKFGRRHGKVVRCMGKAGVREMGTSSSRLTTGEVIALKEEVTTLKGKLADKDEQTKVRDEEMRA